MIFFGGRLLRLSNVWISSTLRKASCHSSSSTATLSCWKRVSRWRWRVSGSFKLIACIWAEYFAAVWTWFRKSSQSLRNSVFRVYFWQNSNACIAVLWYIISSLALFRRISSTVRYVSQRNFSHGVTMARSVRSRDCSPETVDKRIDSGVSLASRSSTLAVAAVVSSVDCTSFAFAWAVWTFSSANSMNFLRTSFWCGISSWLQNS